MKQATANAEQTTVKKKKVWLPVVIVLTLAALTVVAVVIGAKLMHKGKPAPVMLAGSSHYSTFDEWSDKVLLTYSVTLRNDTGADLTDFALRAELPTDYQNGYILSPDASVCMWGEQYSTFSLAAGETKTYDLVLTAKFHQMHRKASGELPQLYAVYPDGSEGKIEIVQK